MGGSVRLDVEAPWVLEEAVLPPAQFGRVDWARRVVTVDCRLSAAQRRCTLAHELVHVERGPVPRDPWLAAREEAAVEADGGRPQGAPRPGGAAVDDGAHVLADGRHGGLLAPVLGGLPAVELDAAAHPREPQLGVGPVVEGRRGAVPTAVGARVRGLPPAGGESAESAEPACHGSTVRRRRASNVHRNWHEMARFGTVWHIPRNDKTPCQPRLTRGFVLCPREDLNLHGLKAATSTSS